MPFLRNALLTLIAATATPLAAQDRPPVPAPAPAFTQPVSNFTRTLKTGVQEMLDATRNREFLNSTLTAEKLEALKTHLGADVARRALGTGGFEGKSVKELVSSRPEIAQQFPQVIAYLAAQQRQQGVRLYGNDRDPQPLEVSSPGRLVPNDDLKRAAGRADSPENLRDYMRSNFGLDDAQIRAYSAFLDLASGKPPGTLSQNKSARSEGPDVASLAQAVKNIPERGPGGLYMPGGDVLSKIQQLLAFQDGFSDEPEADPSRFRGPDGRTLADLIAEFDPDSGKQRSVDDLRRMSRQDVQGMIGQLMERVVKADLEGPNRYLFEMGLAWVKPAGELEDKDGARAKRSTGPTLGNGRVRENHEELYNKLILQQQRPHDRDSIELESEGEFFAIRGRPSDVAQKHYDPPIDPEGSVFGSGMNLDNRPRDGAR
jgi:hypothetical protein